MSKEGRGWGKWMSVNGTNASIAVIYPVKCLWDQHHPVLSSLPPLNSFLFSFPLLTYLPHLLVSVFSFVTVLLLINNNGKKETEISPTPKSAPSPS